MQEDSPAPKRLIVVGDRVLIAPEEGAGLSDLRGFTRDVMHQIEEDLGTRLDWVAVDHYNTGHPHSHVVIRGKDDLGKDLVIAQDYITDGMRLRAEERATLELGPETDLEAVVRSAEVVHMHGLWQAHTRRGARAARGARVPYLITAHGMAEPWALRHKAWKKRIFGSSCRMPSSHCSGAAPTACSVSSGSSNEAPTELCAARL